MSDNRNESDEKIPNRASDRKKAYRYRTRIASGGTLNADEQAWFDNYEATKQRRGPQAEPETPDETGADDGAAPPAGTVDSGGTSGGDSPAIETPPPPPPRVSMGGNRDTGANTASGNWRSKFEQKGGGGRETVVMTIAAQYKAVLDFLAGQIALTGATPLVIPETIWPHIVITVDDILPAEFDLKPSYVVVGATTALVVQRFALRKKVAAAIEEHQRNQAAQPPPPPPPPPAPPPSPPQANPPTRPTTADTVYNDAPPPPPPPPVPIEVIPPTGDYVPRADEVF